MRLVKHEVDQKKMLLKSENYSDKTQTEITKSASTYRVPRYMDWSGATLQ